MKKIMMMVAMIMVLALALAACSKTIEDENMPATAIADDEMEGSHSEDMADDDMEKEDEMTDDAMEKEDEMTDDAMAEPMMKNDGDPAPTFSLQDLDGNTVALKDLEGEKVYVKYWASWCPICVSGLDELDELAGMDNDFKVITIVTPDYKGEKNMADFKEWFDMKETENITVLFDIDGEYAKEFGIRGYPTSAYIGSDGVLVKTQPGHADNDTVISSFEAIH